MLSQLSLEIEGEEELAHIGDKGNDGDLNWRLLRHFSVFKLAITGGTRNIEWLHCHRHIDCHSNKHVNHTIDVECFDFEPLIPFLASIDFLELIPSHVILLKRRILTNKTSFNLELSLVESLSLLRQLLERLLTNLLEVESTGTATKNNTDAAEDSELVNLVFDGYEEDQSR